MAESTPYIGDRLIVFISVFTPLQILATALRFYARSLTARRWGIDDWLVLASLLGQFVASGFAIGTLKQAGVGYHVEWVVENHPGLVTAFFKYLLAISSWYWATINLSKLAICVFYRILFPQRSVLVVLCITAGILICTSVASFIAGLAACRPFEAQWAPTKVQAVSCIDKEKLYVWSTFPNIITDVVLLVLPIPIIWKLHTSRQLKIALLGTFALGGIGIVASILRFVAFDNTSSFTDATWNAVELYIWTLAEPGIYLIAACLITYRPLLDKFTSKVQSQRWPSKSGASAGPGISGYARPTHRTPRKLSSVEHVQENDQDILLPAFRTRGHGFEQLPEPDDRLAGAAPLRSPASGIVKTTNIHMSWDATQNGGYQKKPGY